MGCDVEESGKAETRAGEAGVTWETLAVIAVVVLMIDWGMWRISTAINNLAKAIREHKQP
jgi:Sec-independent protein translocase protein TatA